MLYKGLTHNSMTFNFISPHVVCCCESFLLFSDDSILAYILFIVCTHPYLAAFQFIHLLMIKETCEEMMQTPRLRSEMSCGVIVEVILELQE